MALPQEHHKGAPLHGRERKDTMPWLHQLGRRFRSLFHKEQVEQELDDELRFHLESLVEANLKAGMNPEEARYAALRQFGGVEQVKEKCREARGVVFVE